MRRERGDGVGIDDGVGLVLVLVRSGGGGSDGESTTLATSTVGSAALRAILISMGGGAWYAMMAVTPESQGLNSPRTEDQRGNFPYRGLKASCLLFPCFPETGATFPYVNGDNMIIHSVTDLMKGARSTGLSMRFEMESIRGCRLFGFIVSSNRGL
uniref:Uncharacterized protein n=1 Tax=Vespula pensylvanica TaxID=30213 RepID=A0A834UC68_VESPE|nr:hypothetical protein H0235_006040 [Vespula pensylvanica]